MILKGRDEMEWEGKGRTDKVRIERRDQDKEGNTSPLSNR